MPILRFLVGCVLAAATFAAVAVGVTALSVRKDSARVAAQATSLGVDAHDALTQVKILARQVTVTQDAQALYLDYEQNHLRKVTLPALDASITSFRAAIEHTDDSLNAKGQGLLDTADNAVALDALKIAGVTESMDQTLQVFNQRTEPVLKEAADAMHETEQTMKAVKEVAEDESWQHIPGSLDAITTSMLSTSGNLNAMSVDAKAALHSTLHPKWPLRVLKAVEAVPFNLVRLVF